MTKEIIKVRSASLVKEFTVDANLLHQSSGPTSSWRGTFASSPSWPSFRLQNEINKHYEQRYIL